MFEQFSRVSRCGHHALQYKWTRKNLDLSIHFISSSEKRELKINCEYSKRAARQVLRTVFFFYFLFPSCIAYFMFCSVLFCMFFMLSMFSTFFLFSMLSILLQFPGTDLVSFVIWGGGFPEGEYYY